MSSSSRKNKHPISWDWSTQLNLNPIKNQKTSNSCFAFAICGTLDIIHSIQYPKLDPIELSPQDMYSGLIKNEEEDKAGRTVHYAIDNWVRPNGCVLESSCRYTGSFKQVINNREIYLTIGSTYEINLNNDLNIKKENDKINGKKLERRIVIAPVVAQMVWIEEMHDLKGNDIYSGPKDPEAFTPKDPKKKLEYHAIIIIGYGEEIIGKTLTKYWIIRNSHGLDWGNRGYARINRAPCHGRLLIDVAFVFCGVEVCEEARRLKDAE